MRVHESASLDCVKTHGYNSLRPLNIASSFFTLHSSLFTLHSSSPLILKMQLDLSSILVAVFMTLSCRTTIGAMNVRHELVWLYDMRVHSRTTWFSGWLGYPFSCLFSARWIKFKGVDGSVWGTDTDGSASSAKGSNVQGYYNAKTHQIQFIVNYNMMNVSSECFTQTIDKSRLATFDEEKAKYEEDLKAYKKEHGIN